MSGHHLVPAWSGGARVAAVAATLVVLIGISFPQFAIGAQSNKSGKSAAASVSRAENWDRFSADITLKRSHVDGKGQRRDTAPDIQYRLERTKNGAAWKTSLTLVNHGKQVVQSADGPKAVDVPVAVTRMEDDEDGSPVRFYGRDGKEIRVPTPAEITQQFPDVVPKRTRDAASALLQASAAPRPGAAGRDWADSILAPAGKKDARRKSLEQRFGRPKGQVNKLERYTEFAPDGTSREVLVSPEHALPIEMNVTRAGALVSHTTYEYEPQPDGSQLRRRVRTEQRMSEAAEDRLVTEVELGNVRFERKGGGR